VAHPHGALLEQQSAAARVQPRPHGPELQLQLATASSNSSNPDAWGSWAAQLAAALNTVGVGFDPTQQQHICPQQMQHTALQHHLDRVATAAAEEGRTRLQNYFRAVRGSELNAESHGTAQYLTAVNSLAWRQPLAQLRLGSHWGAEETGRHERRQRSERLCPHCPLLGGPGGIEDVTHICFHCPLYEPARTRHPDLLFAGPPSLKFFLNQPSISLAHFAAHCFHIHKSTNTPT
jgi:hypothetical protein